MNGKFFLVCLLVGLTSACESMFGPDEDDWYIQIELEDAHPSVKAVAAAPHADSKRAEVDFNSPRALFLAENMWLGFSFPFPNHPTTSVQLSGSYGEDGRSAVLFSGLYVARLDVQSSEGEHFDFADEIKREKDEFGFFVFFSPSVISGEGMVLTRARCVEEGDATLILRWVDTSFSSNGTIESVLYPGETLITVTCSRERPAPL